MAKSGESPQTIAWLRRVAIVINSLPDSIGKQLLQDFDSETHDLLTRECASVLDVSWGERDAVLKEFREAMFSPESDVVARDAQSTQDDYPDQFDVGRIATSSAAAEDNLLNSQVSSVVSQWELPRSFRDDGHSESPFAFLDEVSDDLVVELLAGEHAQTIAVVFSSITPKQAARILPRLDSDLQADTVRRIGRLDEIPEAAAAEIAKHLQHRARDLKHERSSPAQRTLQSIISAMPSEVPEPELAVPAVDESSATRHEARDQSDHYSEPADAESGLSTDEVHQHLMQLSPQQLCEALGQVETREALLALCGLPSEVADQAVASLPRARAKQVRRGMANLSSIQLHEIDRAKEAVALASIAPGASYLVRDLPAAA